MSEKPSPTTTVELLKPHTHADEPLEPGTILTLLPEQAKWLADLGVAKILPAASKRGEQ